ncbi:Chalcone synthase [Nymphaea thermarum]|nr:Chalcone synthase [Nymphaea thermarum]
MAPTLDVRQAMLIAEVSRLGKEAAVKAIQESDQHHPPHLFHHWRCGPARCGLPSDQAPRSKPFSPAVGADPLPNIEKGIFEIASAFETILPDSEGAVEGHLKEMGLTIQLQPRLPTLVSTNIEKILIEAFGQLAISDCNSIFFIVHPGGPAILNQMEERLKLKTDKLQAWKDVLSEYGIMSSASVLFVMDEMRKKSKKEGFATTGEGLEWGMLLGIGPGITIDALVLHNVPISAQLAGCSCLPRIMGPVVGAVKSIEEWNQLKSNIAHLIFCTIGGVDSGPTRCRLPSDQPPRPKPLGPARHAVPARLRRWGAALRIANDLADDNNGAMTSTYSSKFQHEMKGHLKELGLTFQLQPRVPSLISTNIEIKSSIHPSYGTGNLEPRGRAVEIEGRQAAS